MKISHLGLSAFLKTAQFGQMTAAAQALGVTQSALSQRIALLESELECALFVRGVKGLKLTESGERLLRYAQSQERLEEELLGELKGANTELAGALRLAGFSSVIRSVLIPALAPWLRSHPKVTVDFRSYEVVELPQVLQQGQADLVVMDYELKRAGVVTEGLGPEEYVVIESRRFKGPSDVYLDHGPLDNATESFFVSQGKKTPAYRRTFMGDTYGIIDGVAQGLGRAVMSKHLVRERSDVRLVSGFKRHLRPVTLHYYERPFYPRLQIAVVKELRESSRGFLT